MKLGVQIHGIKKKVIFLIYLSSICVLVAINPCCVFAWSAGGLKATIASIVVSMMVSSGAGVTNMDWLTQLNNAYGVESSIGTLENAINTGLLTESGGALIDTGLSEAIINNPAYNTLGLDELFATSADDILLQPGTQIATGGANLAAEAITTSTIGTVGQAFTAVGAGIALGVLANHIINRFGNFIRQGQYINEASVYDDYLISGNSFNSGSRTYSGPGSANGVRYITLFQCSNGFPYKYLDNNYWTYGVITLSNQDVQQINFVNGNESQNTTTYQAQYNTPGVSTNTSNNTNITIGGYDFGSRSEFSDFVNSLKDGTGTLPVLKSPDIIGKYGNQEGIYNNGDYEYPAIAPYYNPEEKGIKPIDMDDYMGFAETANDLTDEDKTGSDQADHFKDFVNPYLEDQEPVVPEPNPDYTNPDTIPEQPDYTDKTPVTPEDITDSDPYTTPDLMDRFPFCIPNDILAIFQKFKMGREAPVIDWNFKYPAIGLDEHIVIDLSEYDSVASILRTLELIAFVVGLAFATRYLIGG